jgi:hypothetical protein
LQAFDEQVWIDTEIQGQQQQGDGANATADNTAAATLAASIFNIAASPATLPTHFQLHQIAQAAFFIKAGKLPNVGQSWRAAK